MRCSCLVCLLLFFLLHLSPSSCHATSRNLLLLNPAAADDFAVPAAATSPSMAYGAGDDDQTTAMQVWRSPRKLLQVAAAAMAMESSPPSPLLPDLELSSGGVEGKMIPAPARPDQQEDGSAAMPPFPADDGGGGKDDSGGGGGSSSPSSSASSGGGGGEQHDGGEVHDGDYEPPKTHPPSHN